jgi:hypothetical protein
LAILPPVADNSFRANYSRGLIVVFAQTSPSDVITTRLTLDEYRAMEETNPERHEYRTGEIITMSGGSEAHSAIASNFFADFLLPHFSLAKLLQERHPTRLGRTKKN